LAPTKPEDAVVVSSGADAVVLVAGSTRYRTGRVPPGVYRILATFGGAEVAAGEVTVGAGERVRITCDADFLMCGR